MKFILSAATALLSATTLAAPTPNDNSNSFQIHHLTLHKSADQTTTSVSFNILPSDYGSGDPLDIPCVPYEPITREPTNSFMSGQTYLCDTASGFAFYYTKGQLWLWRHLINASAVSGTAFFVEPPCSTQFNSNDLICEDPWDSYIPITLA
ncbi:hypothetical protein SLS55_007217 [Diplodia seriata]|uniref:AA1-like domain-containing protein n=1 Tax=Diplodia seriata TaxID=420778 RepID=A0ABR3CCQ4_9PEZI